MILAVLDRHLCCHLAILISLSPSPTPTPTPTRIPQPTPTRVRFRFCSTARRKGRWVLSRVLLAIPMHPWTIPMMIFMLVLVLLASSSLGTCAFRPRPSPRSAPHTGCSHGFLRFSSCFFCDFRRVLGDNTGPFLAKPPVGRGEYRSRQTPAVTKPPVGKGEPPTTKETAVLTLKKAILRILVKMARFAVPSPVRVTS